MTNAKPTNVQTKTAETLMFLTAVPVIKNHLPDEKTVAVSRRFARHTPPARCFETFPAGRKNFSRVYSFSIRSGCGETKRAVRGIGGMKTVRCEGV